MEQADPPPPDSQRPWYYRNWFLLPAFVLGWPIGLVLDISVLWPWWPLWPLLIIRSPWHRGFITGTLAWAMLMSTGSLIALRFIESWSDPVSTVIVIAPGLVLTFVIQAMWSKDRRKIHIVGPVSQVAASNSAPSARSRQGRLKRRRRRRASR